jgi:penicillin-binding protein 1B
MEVLRPGETGSRKLVAKLERLLYQAPRKLQFLRPLPAARKRRRGLHPQLPVPGKDFRGFAARVEFGAGKVVSVQDVSGGALPAPVIEPERLGAVFGEEFQDRTLVRLEDLPQSLKDAVLVTEDRDFYRHAGVSIKRLFGAAVSNVRKGGLQGGSTLTQQVVKNLYLRPRDSTGRLGTPARTLRRKALEAVLAVILDARYSKDEIFDLLQRDSWPGIGRVNGVGGRRALFGKDASDLDLAESARRRNDQGPQRLPPVHNPTKAKRGRDLVLRLMREEKRSTTPWRRRWRSRSSQAPGWRSARSPALRGFVKRSSRRSSPGS